VKSILIEVKNSKARTYMRSRSLTEKERTGNPQELSSKQEATDSEFQVIDNLTLTKMVLTVDRHHAMFFVNVTQVNILNSPTFQTV
jgi:hypothetical protein